MSIIGSSVRSGEVVSTYACRLVPNWTCAKADACFTAAFRRHFIRMYVLDTVPGACVLAILTSIADLRDNLLYAISVTLGAPPPVMSVPSYGKQLHVRACCPSMYEHRRGSPNGQDGGVAG